MGDICWSRGIFLKGCVIIPVSVLTSACRRWDSTCNRTGCKTACLPSSAKWLYVLPQYGSAFEVLLSGMDARDARDKGNERSL